MADTWGLDVTAVRIPGLTTYNGEVYKRVLADLLPELNAAYVCAAHSSQGMDFARALAVELNAACITGVEEILEIENRTWFVRSIFGSKALAHVWLVSNIASPSSPAHSGRRGPINPAAAIFQIADICIVEDLTTFIPTLIEIYEKTKK